MVKSRFRKGAKLAGIAAVSTVVFSLNSFAPTPVSADPISRFAFVGVGSDTTQDVTNGLSGIAPYPIGAAGGTPKGYNPLVSSSATGTKGIVSWDAFDASTTPTACITPKSGFPAVDRPNGSGDGQKALSRSIDGGAWTKGLGCNASAGNLTGAIDFARSSSGPPSTFPGTALTYIPFARDAITYAYIAHPGADVTALTSAELKTLFGTANVSTSGRIANFRGTGHTLIACAVQINSGMGKSFDKALGNNGTGATANASGVASGCNNTAGSPAGGVYEENTYDGWTSPFLSALSPTEDAVIAFSAASWISQANGTGLDRSASGRSGGDKLGSIDGVAAITGTAPNEAPNDAYYANTTYGRDVYVVVQTSRVPAIGGDAGLKSVFRGAGAAICSAANQLTINKFGFSSATAKPCGTTGDATLQSGLVS